MEFALFCFGEKQAKLEAESRATRTLRRQLTAAHDVAPCPQCGFVHAGMVKEAQDNSYEWMSVLAIVAGFFFIFALAASLNSGRLESHYQLICNILAISTGLTAFGLAFLQSFLRHQFNPNNWPLVLRLEIVRARCHPEWETSDSIRKHPGAKGTTSAHVNSVALPTVSDNGATSFEGDDNAESVSSADLSTAALLYWKGAVVAFLGVMLLALNPGQWRSLAAFAFAGVLWFMAYKSTQCKP